VSKLHLLITPKITAFSHVTLSWKAINPNYLKVSGLVRMGFEPKSTCLVAGTRSSKTITAFLRHS